MYSTCHFPGTAEGKNMFLVGTLKMGSDKIRFIDSLDTLILLGFIASKNQLQQYKITNLLLFFDEIKPKRIEYLLSQ